MIKDLKLWEEFEIEWTKSSKLNFDDSFRLFEEMQQIAISTGYFQQKDLLTGLAEKVEFVKRMQKR